MKLDIDRTLELPIAADQAWRLLEDVEAVASCLPGAKITEQIDASHYKGAVAVKLGPASVNFKGEMEILSRDPETRQIHLAGRGSDGASSAATMELTGSVREAGPGACQLTGRAEITINGKVASFGARLITSVSDQLLNQFFANLRRKTESMQSAAPAGIGAETVSPAAPEKLNVLTLLWAVLREFLAGLWSRKRVT
jgi:carbon monoxide dehydrogenase subunit G